MKYSLVVILICLWFGANGQIITTVAGTGVAGSSLVGGQATNVPLNYPWDVEVDATGNIYFSEQANSVVSRVDVNTGEISNILGTGTPGTGQNGALGPDFQITSANFIFIDKQNNMMYVSDHGSSKIYKMNLSDSTVSVIAGNGTAGYTADGNPAASSSINYPMGVALGNDGLVYFAENQNHIIRRINADGNLHTVAGIAGSSGTLDGSISSATFLSPMEIYVDANGDVLVMETLDGKLRKVNTSLNTVTTIVGSGTVGFNGDGLTALATQFNIPHSFAVDSQGNIFIADVDNNRIRKVDALTNLVSTIAGTGNPGYSGDGGQPNLAELDGPLGICLGAGGKIYFTDLDNNVVRKIQPCTPAAPPMFEIYGDLSDNGDSSFCPGNIDIRIVNADLNDSQYWLWYESDCGTDSLVSQDSLFVNLTTTTTYWVRGEGGCDIPGGCGKIQVKIGSCEEELPVTGEVTAFSPNFDGVNDYLYINEADSNVVNTVRIYNRWGNEVISFPNYDNQMNSWDGLDNSGRDVPVGTYYYIFESDGIEKLRWVQLLR